MCCCWCLALTDCINQYLNSCAATRQPQWRLASCAGVHQHKRPFIHPSIRPSIMWLIRWTAHQYRIGNTIAETHRHTDSHMQMPELATYLVCNIALERRWSWSIYASTLVGCLIPRITWSYKAWMPASRCGCGFSQVVATHVQSHRLFMWHVCGHYYAHLWSLLFSFFPDPSMLQLSLQLVAIDGVVALICFRASFLRISIFSHIAFVIALANDK